MKPSHHKLLSLIKATAAARGVATEFDANRKHPRVIFTRGERSRYIAMASTPSTDNTRAVMKDARRAIEAVQFAKQMVELLPGLGPNDAADTVLVWDGLHPDAAVAP